MQTPILQIILMTCKTNIVTQTHFSLVIKSLTRHIVTKPQNSSCCLKDINSE